jgi:hypothetical protein
MKVVANIFEESVKVLLNNLVLRPDEVSPLYRHVVEGYEQLVQFVDTSSLRDTISQVSASFMKFSKQIAHFVQSINLVCLNSLESFSLTRDLFVQSFHFRHKLFEFLHIGFVFKAEVDCHLSTFGLYVIYCCIRLHFISISFHLDEG